MIHGKLRRASLSAGSDHCLNDITELVSVLPSLQPV